MPLYHSTHQKLNAGDIIQPGNWGKMIYKTGESHSCWNREIVLEKIRQKKYPDKPSRLNGCFACDNLQTIEFYKNHFCPKGYIYEVEIVDTQAPQHLGDFNAVEPLPGLNLNMEEIADRYWRYAQKTNIQGYPELICSEILTSSSLRVIRSLPTT